ncbi:hypothetical protein B0T25DRAFT_316162 [Lasiosphaeria hispida]|uniref:Prion-inhibition and propagation HeLo domain-containing protein n=1 Tax=Lasiosphaeria hispida TaxID=260671 RepID=A0AAJ0H966_9PEZI|nr:hypothetical protein B0T25DRAFT_316162 [Lasiosphaeria hispida]
MLVLEIFGAASGTSNIASAFTACVDIFEYVKLGGSFGTDFQTANLKLNVLRLRLSRRGEAISVYGDAATAAVAPNTEGHHFRGLDIDAGKDGAVFNGDYVSADFNSTTARPLGMSRLPHTSTAVLGSKNQKGLKGFEWEQI